MIAADVHLGENVVICHPDLVNLYGCEIGDGCGIGAFVEIRKQVKIGRIEDGAFIGPHVCFTNDKYPLAVNPDGSLQKYCYST